MQHWQFGWRSEYLLNDLGWGQTRRTYNDLGFLEVWNSAYFFRCRIFVGRNELQNPLSFSLFPQVPHIFVFCEMLLAITIRKKENVDELWPYNCSNDMYGFLRGYWPMAFGRTNRKFGAFGDLKKKLKDISEVFPSFYLDFIVFFANTLLCFCYHTGRYTYQFSLAFQQKDLIYRLQKRLLKVR